MGDRTTVTLTVPNEFADTVEEIEEAQERDPSTEGDLIYLTYYEVNYGELRFLEKLKEQGIPYDSAWCAGCEYGSGTRSLRFTPEGEAIELELYDADANPEMRALMVLIDDPVALRQYILDHQASRQVLPWDNQVEYGKIYRTRQLIAPQ